MYRVLSSSSLREEKVGSANNAVANIRVGENKKAARVNILQHEFITLENWDRESALAQ